MRPTPASFAERLLQWFDRHGRTDLPWQHPRTPYRVWVSEIMLQQTQVTTVIGYFERFMARFPTLETLANAADDDVMALWAGLGYYARARNLHNTARLCVAHYDGDLPNDIEQLVELPGIGQSTAAAILAQAHGQRHAILDGNVKRVLSRHEAIGSAPQAAATLKLLWSVAEHHTPHERLADYTQAIMDLGATVCTRTRPACLLCPVNDDCKAFQQGTPEKYPARKPKKVRPEKHRYLLIRQDEDGRIALEKRPSGLWGGLYCPPVVEQLPDEEHELGEPFSHDFSHYRIHLTPVLIVTAVDLSVEDSDARWVGRDGLRSIGMPAPIAKFLANLARNV